MSGRMMTRKGIIFLLVIGAIGLLLQPSPLSAKTIYRGEFDVVKLIPAPSDLIGGEAPAHPATISESQLYNILASLHFDQRILIMKDKEDERLFDQRGLQLLAPYLSQGLAEATEKQVVYFRYIKKAPQLRVLRNDRLIVGEAFVRSGELFIRFKKIYAKVFGDYHRAGQEGEFLRRAKDINVSFRIRDGQRMVGEKFVALTIAHDFYSDLEKEHQQAEAEKEAAKAAETVRGVPLPQVESGQPGKAVTSKVEKPKAEPRRDAPATIEATPAGESDIVVRLKTLEELKEKELITNKEYQQKKKEILEGL